MVHSARTVGNKKARTVGNKKADEPGRYVGDMYSSGERMQLCILGKVGS